MEEQKAFFFNPNSSSLSCITVWDALKAYLTGRIRFSAANDLYQKRLEPKTASPHSISCLNLPTCVDIYRPDTVQRLSQISCFPKAPDTSFIDLVQRLQPINQRILYQFCDLISGLKRGPHISCCSLGEKPRPFPLWRRMQWRSQVGLRLKIV